MLPLRNWISRSAVVMGLGLVAVAGNAMRVSPMVVEMESTGSNATARIEVQNLNRANLAFETRVTRVAFGADGAMTETPSDEDFLVFPPQGVLPQQGRQVVRLQWTGGALEASRAYYLSVNQLPVQLEPNAEGGAGAQVQILYHMKALVVVAPPGATPNVKIASAHSEPFQPPAEPGSDKLPSSVPGVAITLMNDGRRHAMTAAVPWIISGKNSKGEVTQVTLSLDDLSKAIGTGYVPALDGERTFRIPTPVEFAPGPISVRFQQQ